MKKISIYVSVGLLITAVAMFSGWKAGRCYGQEKYERQRTEITKGVLEKMQNLDIGNRIPDHEFEDLDGNLVRLSSLVHGETVLTFFLPDCPNCIEEAEELLSAVSDSSDLQYFIWISDFNPRHIIELRDKYQLEFPILYDHRRVFMSQFGMYTFPFNLVINKEMEVVDMTTGMLMNDEFHEVIAHNKLK